MVFVFCTCFTVDSCRTTPQHPNTNFWRCCQKKLLHHFTNIRYKLKNLQWWQVYKIQCDSRAVKMYHRKIEVVFERVENNAEVVVFIQEGQWERDRRRGRQRRGWTVQYTLDKGQRDGLFMIQAAAAAEAAGPRLKWAGVPVPQSRRCSQPRAEPADTAATSYQ